MNPGIPLFLAQSILVKTTIVKPQRHWITLYFCMMRGQFFFIIMFHLTILILNSGCRKDDQDSSQTLQAYIDDQAQWKPHNQLVACAAGGQEGFLDDPTAPLSMFFYPKLYSTNFKYFESSSLEIDTGDLAQFIERDVPIEPLFNGFMARFPLPKPSEDRWARVSFVSNDTLWYCKPVRYKIYEKPTQFRPEILSVSIDSAFQPTFHWPSEGDASNIIYFQIVVDERGDALSATYTTEKTFSYYILDNVVFNVTRPGPILPLLPQRDYSIVLMGISDDNWVNTIAETSFRTE